MSGTFPTTWTIEAHTKAKHEILKRYFDAWLPIMTSWTVAVFIDGFAGPGSYAGGEPGSPIIVLDAATNHKPPIRGEVYFLFIEKDPRRFEILAKNLADRQQPVPSNFHVTALPGEFLQIEKDLDMIHQKGEFLAPTLAFIDPFGVTGFPWTLVAKILKNPRSEVIVTFMVETLDRFGTSVLSTQTREIFGDDSWRSCSGLSKQRERQVCLVNAYRRRLKEAGARFTLAFEMADSSDRTIYFLIYATQHQKGMEKMKEAMSRVDPALNYRFSDLRPAAQRRVFQFGDESHWVPQAADSVWKQFEAKTAHVSDVEDYVVCNEDMPFPWRKAILRELLYRAPPAVEYVDPPRRPGEFPDRLRVRFAARS